MIDHYIANLDSLWGLSSFSPFVEMLCTCILKHHLLEYVIVFSSTFKTCPFPAAGSGIYSQVADPQRDILFLYSCWDQPQ